ncbi:hypothetical protein ACFS07_27410 [Undibacterium arcticum]
MADYNDQAALAELGQLCVAVTTEFENVAAQSLAFLAERTIVAPAAHGVSIAQDRIAEKEFLHRLQSRIKGAAGAASPDRIKGRHRRA